MVSICNIIFSEIKKKNFHVWVLPAKGVKIDRSFFAFFTILHDS